jgi:hypothetical protein
MAPSDRCRRENALKAWHDNGLMSCANSVGAGVVRTPVTGEDRRDADNFASSRSVDLQSVANVNAACEIPGS